MFEDSLMESAHTINATSKYWSVPALFLNGGVLIALAIWPLMHPEVLPMQMMPSLLIAPAPAPAPPAAPPPKAQIKSEMLSSELLAPSRIPKEIKLLQESAMPPSMESVMGLEGLAVNSAGNLLGSTGTAPVIVVQAVRPQKVSISSGVMAGNLIQETLPQYPAIAKAARIEGTVMLQATISKAGLIKNLRVIGGPAMLQQAAVDAVRSWRYKPYLLNGEPVEVDTTVNVVFTLDESHPRRSFAPSPQRATSWTEARVLFRDGAKVRAQPFDGCHGPLGAVDFAAWQS